MTKVTIDRELLEQVASEFERDNDRYMLGRELRKVLDAPRQPEGDGLEVVATLEIGDYDDDESVYAELRKELTIAEVCEDDKLCRLSDAQRAIAELREECERLRTEKAQLVEDRARFPDRPDFIGNMIAAHFGNLRAGQEQAKKFAASHRARMERAEAECDTLRQQLAERDATIARLEAGIPRIQEQSHQMRQQRERLAEAVRKIKDRADVFRESGMESHSVEALELICDAALAEVKQ